MFWVYLYDVLAKALKLHRFPEGDEKLSIWCLLKIRLESASNDYYHISGQQGIDYRIPNRKLEKFQFSQFVVCCFSLHCMSTSACI